MRKIALAVFLALFLSTAFALEFRPSTVKGIDVTVTTTAVGGFSGEITRGDELEVLYLSVQEDEGQEILELNEYMEIGGEAIQAGHVTRDGLRYARYSVKDLLKYAKKPEFTVVREARVMREAKIGLGNDYNLGAGIASFEEYKAQTEYIEADDPELRSKASLEFTSDSQIESIRQIAEWVNRNIEYDFENYYDGVYSAKETYNSRAGVCDEFANLTAAFTRIRGMPTRYVTGLSFDGQRFGLHGWLEVFLPGTGWVGVDSTYGEAGYLDAAHITFAKTTDANSAIDFIATTKSRKPISISAELPLPEAEINSIEFFESLLEAEIEKPEAVQPGELFEVKAVIRNVSGENAILPVELRLHGDFAQEREARLVYFEAGSEREIIWEARAPEREIESGYYNYGMVLLLPDGNRASELKVVPKREGAGEGARIRIGDVSPFINGENLEIRIRLENIGDRSGDALLEVFFGGEPLGEKTIETGAFEEKTVSYIVRNIRPGSVQLRITTSVTKAFEITIPENREEEVEAHEIAEEEVATREPESTFPGFGEQELLQAIGAGVIILIMAMALLFSRK